MNNLFINPDNANWQAQGVLAAIRRIDGLEASRVPGGMEYRAEPEVNSWHNGRERGYVISLNGFGYSKRMNIAFFEHRNSDSICAVMFETYANINPPTINDIPDDHPYVRSKWDYDFSAGCGEFIKMSDWIIDRMNEFWDSEFKTTD